MKKTLTLLMILTAQPALTDPIRLLGIDLSMTIEEQQEDLTKSGFECSIQSTLWGTGYRTCINGKMEINPDSEKLIYNCDVFNACNYSLKKFAQAFIDRGIVSSLEYKSKMVKADRKYVLIESYCGNGEDGDRLCVVADKNLLDQTLLKVSIEKGSLGAGGIKIE